MKKFALVALLVLLLASCATTKQNATDITAVVPDKAFRTWLVDNGYATRVSRHRLRPTAEGLALTEMACYEQNIHSLQGIEMFQGLTSLVCSGNPIEHLDLNGLPGLEKVYGIDMPL